MCGFDFRKFRLVGAFVGGALALALLAGDANAGSTVTRKCQVASGSDARFSVVYTTEATGSKVAKQYDADLEIAPGRYFEGQRVKFLVKGVKVAVRRLVEDKNKDLEADLKLTTRKKRGRNSWPDNFPIIRSGTTVAVQIGRNIFLSCTLL